MQKRITELRQQADSAIQAEENHGPVISSPEQQEQKQRLETAAQNGKACSRHVSEPHALHAEYGRARLSSDRGAYHVASNAAADENLTQCSGRRWSVLAR
jgi:hypothetical protein